MLTNNVPGHLRLLAELAFVASVLRCAPTFTEHAIAVAPLAWRTWSEARPYWH